MTDTFIPPSPVTIDTFDAPAHGTGFAIAQVVPLLAERAGPWVSIEALKVQAWAWCDVGDPGTGVLYIDLTNNPATGTATSIAGGTFSSGDPSAINIGSAADYAFARWRVFGDPALNSLHVVLQSVPGLESSSGSGGGSGTIEEITSSSLLVTGGTGPDADIELAIESDTLTVTTPTQGTFKIEISETGASLNVEEGSASNVGPLNNPTTVLTTAALSVGTWLVVASGYAGLVTNGQIALIATEGTATATLSGATECLVGSDPTLVAAFAAFSLSFVAVVSDAGTLEFNAEPNLNGVMDFTLLGYVAVQLDPIPIGGSGVTEITSTGNTISITDAEGPIANLEAGIADQQAIAGTTGSADLFEYSNPGGGSYTVLAFDNYTNTVAETVTFEIPFADGNVGIPSWGISPALTLSLTEIGIPIIASALTGVFVVMGY